MPSRKDALWWCTLAIIKYGRVIQDIHKLKTSRCYVVRPCIKDEGIQKMRIYGIKKLLYSANEFLNQKKKELGKII